MTKSLDTIKIGCIGLGNMGTAISRGLVSAMKAENIHGFDTDADRVSRLASETGIKPASTIKEITDTCDFIILAVKPDRVVDVTSGLKDSIKTGTVLISVAAGISIGIIESALQKKQKIIRCMPNTPSLVGAGMMVLSPNEEMDGDNIDTACRMFEALGKVLVLPEKMMDAVTGVSGSGPAYVFTMINAMADGAIRMGIPRPEALTLAAQTVYGAAKMVLESGEDPFTLRGRVTSPGGTTIEGVFELEDAGFSGIVMRAVEAATNRSKQLGSR